ncbi:MAG: STAS domain-containing protein, partial [Oscillospiraceae bacterium]|nr:STAS domain-containing protein [Oscillospiraceae bacterium]
MPAKITQDEDKLTVYLSGELDHHSCIPIREQADAEIIKTNPKEVILDFKGVTFMDSSGIGLIMGR